MADSVTNPLRLWPISKDVPGTSGATSQLDLTIADYLEFDVTNELEVSVQLVLDTVAAATSALGTNAVWTIKFSNDGTTWYDDPTTAISNTAADLERHVDVAEVTKMRVANTAGSPAGTGTGTVWVQRPPR